jgi:hypothetical protein
MAPHPPKASCPGDQWGSFLPLGVFALSVRLLLPAPARKALIAAAAMSAALSVSMPQAAFASVSIVPDSTAKVAGGVYALAQSPTDGRVFLGGSFTKAGGKAHVNLAALQSDGTVDPLFNAGTDGRVDALAVSQDGSILFAGGTFNEVTDPETGSVSRANLAALNSTTGEVLGSWQADTTGTTPQVDALRISGDTLYVGGRFGGIDGTTRNKLVALGATGGDVITSFRPRPNGKINEIRVSPDGSTVYVGGGFTSLGGQARVAAGAVQSTNGDATSFAPQVDGGNAVTIELSPDGADFYATTENNTVFDFRTDSNAPRWSVKMSGNTQAMAWSANDLYIGGHFSQVITTKEKRPFFASLNPTTGAVNAWNPNASGGKMGVWALLFDADRNQLHAGGVFSYFGSVAQRGYARFTS